MISRIYQRRESCVCKALFLCPKIVNECEGGVAMKDIDENRMRRCKECGKPFKPRSGNQHYCDNDHYKNCIICGTPILVKRPYLNNPPKTCSKECWKILKERTCIEKYGVSDPGNQLKEFQDKRKQTCLERYGVENPAQAEVSRKKIHEHFDSMTDEDWNDIVTRRKQTCIDKYGVDNPLKSAEVRDQIKKTNLERYGHVCSVWGEEPRKKANETIISKWGSEYGYASDPDILTKRRQTCIEKYGVVSYSSTKEFRDRFKNTMLGRYGVDHPMHSQQIVEKVKNSTISSQGIFPAWFKEEYMNKQQAHHSVRVSKTQLDMYNRLLSAGLECELEKQVGTKFFDIFIPSLNILIEVDPSYTHSQQDNGYHWTVSPNYHLEKTKLGSENGYRCIHVFDWDDRNKIARLLQPDKQRIYGRNCNIRFVEQRESDRFFIANHLQGTVRGNLICIGLEYDNRLISCMSFGKSRYDKKFQWELLRYATDSDFYVVGGAQKLLQTFIKEFEPESIISYCDLAKFEGDVYPKLGMKVIRTTQPAKIWSKDNKKITDNLLRARGYDQLFKTDYGKGTSNEDLMLSDGWRTVYDCGQLVFGWHR